MFHILSKSQNSWIEIITEILTKFSGQNCQYARFTLSKNGAQSPNPNTNDDNLNLVQIRINSLDPTNPIGSDANFNPTRPRNIQFKLKLPWIGLGVEIAPWLFNSSLPSNLFALYFLIISGKWKIWEEKVEGV